MSYWDQLDVDKENAKAWDLDLQRAGAQRVFAVGPVMPTDAATVQAAMLGYYLAHAGYVVVNGAGPGAMDLLSFGAWTAHTESPSGRPAPAGLAWGAEGQIPTAWIPEGRVRPVTTLALRQDVLGRNISGLHVLPDGGDGTIYEVIDHVVQVTRGTRPELYPINGVQPDVEVNRNFAGRLIDVLTDLYKYGELVRSFRSGAQHTFPTLGSARESVDYQMRWESAAAGIERYDGGFSITNEKALTADEFACMRECLTERFELAPVLADRVRVRDYEFGAPVPRINVEVAGPSAIAERLVMGSLTEALMHPDLDHSIRVETLPSETEVAARLKNGMELEAPNGVPRSDTLEQLGAALPRYCENLRARQRTLGLSVSH